MALTTATFLHNVARVRELGDEALGEAALDRLLRLAERCMALEAALGADDPGHNVTAAVVRPTESRTKAVWNFSRMGRALLASTGPFEPGVCRVCGCTETTACSIPFSPAVGDELARSVGCSWVEGSNRTLCSRPECVAAGIAVGDVVLPPNCEPPAEIAKFLPEEEPCFICRRKGCDLHAHAPGRHERGWNNLSGLKGPRGWTNR
jgi:hypothetical protein